MTVCRAIPISDCGSNRLLIWNVGHGHFISDMRPAGVHALCVRILGPRLLASLPSFIVIGSCIVVFRANCYVGTPDGKALVGEVY